MQIHTRPQPIQRQILNLIPTINNTVDCQNPTSFLHDRDDLLDHLDTVRVWPVVEDEAEGVDVCAGDGLRGEDVVALEGY